MANLDSEEASRLYNFYSLTGCKIKIYDIPVRDASTGGDVKPTIREFQIEDLLFREPVKMDKKEEFDYYVEDISNFNARGIKLYFNVCNTYFNNETATPKGAIIVTINKVEGIA